MKNARGQQKGVTTSCWTAASRITFKGAGAQSVKQDGNRNWNVGCFLALTTEEQRLFYWAGSYMDSLLGLAMSQESSCSTRNGETRGFGGHRMTFQIPQIPETCHTHLVSAFHRNLGRREKARRCGQHTKTGARRWELRWEAGVGGTTAVKSSPTHLSKSTP